MIDMENIFKNLGSFNSQGNRPVASAPTSGQPTWLNAAGAYEISPGWWRSPQVGGGLEWSPQYGYQRKQDVNSGKQLTANSGQDWQTLFPGSRTDRQLTSMGVAGKGNLYNWEAFKQPGGYYDYSSWKPGWTPNAQQQQAINAARQKYASNTGTQYVPYGQAMSGQQAGQGSGTGNYYSQGNGNYYTTPQTQQQPLYSDSGQGSGNNSQSGFGGLADPSQYGDYAQQQAMWGSNGGNTGQFTDSSGNNQLYPQQQGYNLQSASPQQYYPTSTSSSVGSDSYSNPYGGSDSYSNPYGGSDSYSNPYGNIPSSGQNGTGGQVGGGADFGGTSYGQTAFNYPSQLGKANDIFSAFSHGQPTAVPNQWQTATGIGNYYGSNGGQPTSADPWYQAAVSNANNNITDSINQAKEQAGLGGMRWSTPLGRTAQQVAGQQMAAIAPQYAQLTQTALENAANRQMQAGQNLYTIGQGTSGLEEAAKQRSMEAGQNLANLGTQYFNMPFQTSQALMNEGQAGQTQQQNQANTWLQQWQQQQPYNNPWLNLGSSMVGAQGQSQYTPQQNQQSTGNAILGGIMGMLPMLFM